MRVLKKYRAIYTLAIVFILSTAILSCDKLSDEDQKAPPITGNEGFYIPEPADPGTETSPTSLPTGVIISESLKNGYTTGAISDGTLTASGLQLSGGDGFIRYSIPTTSYGYVEFSATGFVPNELHGGEEFKAVLLTMWSGNDGYSYEDAPYIFELRKFGYIAGRPDATDCLQLRVKSNGVWEAGQFSVMSWSLNTPYRFRVEWGGGHTSVQRDGQMVASATYVPEFAPSSHQVQIGAQPLRSKESPYNLLISDVVIGTR